MGILEGKVIYIFGTGARKISLLPKAIREFTCDGARVYTMMSELGRELASLDDFRIPGNQVVSSYSKEGESLPLEDLVLVAPCTFNTLNKIAGGIADTYPLTITSTAIGNKRKVMAAPAMNFSLWNHPITESSIARLSSWGCRVIYPEITPEKVTMAPIEKISDSVYCTLVGARYESEQVPSDVEFDRLVDVFYPTFRRVGEEMVDLGLTHGTSGCMSLKTNGSILVTSTGAQVGSLSKDEISLILRREGDKFCWQGARKPSSESPLFYELYSKTGNSGAIIHGHCPRITYHPSMGRYATDEYIRYGVFGQGNKVLRVLENNDGFAIMKLHGELSMGKGLLDSLNNLKRRLEEAHE